MPTPLLVPVIHLYFLQPATQIQIPQPSHPTPTILTLDFPIIPTPGKEPKTTYKCHKSDVNIFNPAYLFIFIRTLTHFIRQSWYSLQFCCHPSLSSQQAAQSNNCCTVARKAPPSYMEQTRWLMVTILITLLATCSARDLKVKHKDHRAVYNHTLSTILVEYASAVYISDLMELFTWTCPRCDDLTTGFEVVELVVDVQHCLQGFVGVAKDLNAIVIAFRGTQERSIQNWVEDLYWKQLDLNYPGMPDAMVHHGFYFAYHNTTVRPCVVKAVKRAKQLYGDIDIMITGHSMGGAMAAFCGLDLTVNHEGWNVKVVTFGQPRIGNAAFVSYYSKLMPDTIRVINEHDIVPHLPPYYSRFAQKTYHHFPREVWLYHLGFGSLIYPVEKVCDASGEDPFCSRSVVGNSISDHLEYYGVELGALGSDTCRIVVDSRLAAYSTRDQAGNFILSRDPSSSGLTMELDTSEPIISI